MRDDIILASTARRLRAAGLRWVPQVGDWCVLLDGMPESQAGIWLVIVAEAAFGWAEVKDIAGQWPPARIATTDALWLPTAGQLKAWLRAQGYQVTTVEGALSVMSAEYAATPVPPAKIVRQGWAAAILGGPQQPTPASRYQAATSPIRHRCIAYRDGLTNEATGLTESEAVAEVVMHHLASGER